MTPEDLQKQYGRFLVQTREEAKDLYWLYNFFFVIESALLGALLVGKLSPTYLGLAQAAGLVLAIYWLAIVHKQRLWRNGLIRRIQKIEIELGYENHQIWPSKEPRAKLKDYILGKRGLWRFLFFLPIAFGLIWLLLIIGQ